MMIPLAAMNKVVRFGLLGAVGCLAGWLVGEPLLALTLPDATADGAPSLVSRSPEPTVAPEFKERLDKTGAKSGDVQISLIWDGRHDLDLHCVDPDGETIYFNNRTSRSGGQLDVDSNAACEKDVRDNPVENIFWAKGGAPNGEYNVYVDFYTPCPREARVDPARKDFETPFRVRILADGEEKLLSGKVSFTPGFPLKNRVLVHTFRVGPKIRIEAPAAATARTGSPLALPFRLTRVNTPGAAEVTATRLPEGVKAAPVTVPAGETAGTLTLTADGAKPGTVEIELTVTANGRSGAASVSLTVAEGVAWSWRIILVLAAWTALLASGLTAALVVGQNLYLGRPWSAGGLPVASVGAVCAGALSGGVGQGLYFALALMSRSLGGVGFFAGWLLLGALLGFGVSCELLHPEPRPEEGRHRGPGRGLPRGDRVPAVRLLGRRLDRSSGGGGDPGFLHRADGGAGGGGVPAGVAGGGVRGRRADHRQPRPGARPGGE
jgi:hypothetical protein